MSEHQRLITKYVQDLSIPISVRYHFHFLRNETDQSARQMLETNLHTFSRESGNTKIESQISTHSASSFPIWAEHSPEGAVSDDPSQRGLSQFTSLQLRLALASLEQAKRENLGAFYRERLEIALVYQRWPEALSLAHKGRFPEGAFVSAIGAGDFDTAGRSLDLLVTRLRAPRDKGQLVSIFELVHLIVWVSLATKTSDEVRGVVELARRGTDYDIGPLTDWAELFVQCRWKEFVARLPHWRGNHFGTSYYASVVREQLEAAIERNVLANTVRPYASVTLAQVAEECDHSEDFVLSALPGLIREGKVGGSIDYVQRTFTSGDEGTHFLELAALLQKTLTVKERANILEWQVEYGPAIVDFKRERQ
jgi:hypothetical protein